MRRALLLTVLAFAATSTARAQQTIPLAPERWTATDSLRFVTYLGRPSLYINRGVALANGVALREGVIEYDMATPKGGNFMGLVFHATSAENSEVVYFRPASSGLTDAVQYAPALNSVAAAWQVYHGEGANAAVRLAFDQWLHVRIDISGVTARMYLDGDSAAALIIPRLAGVAGSSIGVWTGYFGRGAYYSNIRYTPRAAASPSPAPALPKGTITDWELSAALDASSLIPGTLPDLAALHWDRVHTEDAGFVLVNRYRKPPNTGIPVDRSTGGPMVDSIMGGRVAGAKVVFARATIESDREETRRLWFGYSDGATIFLNGRPLFTAMNPSGLRCCDIGMSSLDVIGTAIYLPLRKGRNDLVFAVTEFTGGWAYWARLDPR